MKSRRSIELLDILCIAFTFSAKYEMNNKVRSLFNLSRQVLCIVTDSEILHTNKR